MFSVGYLQGAEVYLGEACAWAFFGNNVKKIMLKFDLNTFQNVHMTCTPLSDF